MSTNPASTNSFRALSKVLNGNRQDTRLNGNSILRLLPRHARRICTNNQTAAGLKVLKAIESISAL
jgi:hypothetical protein